MENQNQQPATGESTTVENNDQVVSNAAPTDEQPTIGEITRVEHNGQLVLTTAQLAEFYGTSVANLKMNFGNNNERFVEGKHYFKFEGDELADFKDKVKSFYLVQPNARILYLWTKRGAARHAKMLNTDRAWEVYELLEDNYFNPKTKPAQTDACEDISKDRIEFERERLETDRKRHGISKELISLDYGGFLYGHERLAFDKERLDLDRKRFGLDRRMLSCDRELFEVKSEMVAFYRERLAFDREKFEAERDEFDKKNTQPAKSSSSKKSSPKDDNLREELIRFLLNKLIA